LAFRGVFSLDAFVGCWPAAISSRFAPSTAMVTAPSASSG